MLHNIVALMQKPASTMWTPANLFASGEQGIWLDPSDLTTLFTTRYGGPTVTTDGQPIGLWLDKSKGLVEGVGLTISAWTNYAGAPYDTFTTSGSEILSAVNTIGNAYASTNKTNMITGAWYKLTVNLNLISGTAPTMSTGSTTTSNVGSLTNAALVNGINTILFRYTGDGNDYLWIENVNTTTSFSLSITSATVAGNHVIAPNDAARPLYKSASGFHWVQFDGVDDRMDTAVFPIAALPGDAFIGLQPDATATKWIGLWLTAQGPAGGYWSVAESGAGTSPTGTLCGAPVYRKNGVDLVAPTRGSLYTALANQKTVHTAKGLTLGNTTATGVSISGFVGWPIKANIYSVILRGARSSAQQITDTEAWINGKIGAY